MGRTYRNEPNPDRIRRVGELRRSNAAGPHRKGGTRKSPEQQAIEESLLEDDLADEALTYWARDDSEFDEDA